MVMVELLMREVIISIAMVTLMTTMVMTDDYEEDDVSASQKKQNYC